MIDVVEEEVEEVLLGFEELREGIFVNAFGWRSQRAHSLYS